jgi:hypothetical protein
MKRILAMPGQTYETIQSPYRRVQNRDRSNALPCEFALRLLNITSSCSIFHRAPGAHVPQKNQNLKDHQYVFFMG